MKNKRFFNFAKSFLVLGAMSASAFVAADSYGYNQVNNGWNNCAPVCAPVCAPACCEPCCPQPQAPQCSLGFNPPGYFNCCEKSHGSFIDSLRVEADFLYWRATSGSVALGYTDVFTNSSPTSSLTSPVDDKISYVDVKPKFEPAFRLGVSHTCDCWDAGIYWTHFHSKETAKAASNFPAVTPGTFPTAATYTAVHPFWETIADSIPDNAKGSWILDLDYVDLDMGYKYYVTSCFKLRPHAAIRILRLDQSYHYTASASRLPPVSTFAAITLEASSNIFASTSKATNDFLGAGPLAGIDLQFDIGCGLSLFGKAAGTIVFGRDRRNFSETYIDYDSLAEPTAGVGRALTFEQDHPTRSTSGTISDLEIGLKWERCINWCNGCHPISFAISWEHHGFYDFSNLGFQSGGTEYESVLAPVTNPVANGSIHQTSTAGTIYTQGVTFAFNVGF